MGLVTARRSTINPLIFVAELYGGNVANRIVKTTDGTNMIMSQLVNADVDPAAAIAYSKLALSNSILNADVNSAAAIAYSKLALSNSILNADVAAAAAIATTKIANGTKGQALYSGASNPAFDITQRKNYIRNNQCHIAQRSLVLGSTVTMTDNTYQSVDRWRSLVQAGTKTIGQNQTQQNGTSRQWLYFKTDGGAHKFGAFYTMELEDCTYLRNQVVSLQCQNITFAGTTTTDVRMALCSWTGSGDVVTSPVSTGNWGAAGTNPTLSTNWAYVGSPVSVNPAGGPNSMKIEGVTVPSGMNNLGILVWIDDTTTTNNDAVAFTDFQLEKGNVCTDVERVSLAQEWVDCLYYTWCPVNLYWGRCYSAYSTQFTIGGAGTRFPIPMKATPTISNATFTNDVSPGTPGTPSMDTATRYGARVYNSGTAWSNTSESTLTAIFSAEL